MKYTRFFVVVCFIAAISAAAYADNSKKINVDLDVKTTKIIKADLDQDDLYYYIDTNACICWVSQTMGSNFAIATFDCAKLAAHPKLADYVEECGKGKENAKSEMTATPDSEKEKAVEPKEDKKGKNKHKDSKKDAKDEKVKDDKAKDESKDETKTKDEAKTLP